MKENDAPYLAALINIRELGGRRILKIREAFDTFQSAFKATKAELTQAKIEPHICDIVIKKRQLIDPNKIMDKLAHYRIKMVPFGSKEYPELLSQIYDPPAALFVRGEPLKSTIKLLAVVGSRLATHYGREATKYIVEPIAKAGIGIVSGLAYGIDTCAHEAALNVDGYTIAILASGVDTATPRQQQYLADKILDKGGSIISEFPIETPPAKHHFPIRNRLISGMCLATLVVEASIKSGSLITANSANEQGREVFAVPGPITSKVSSGTNYLIQTGAHLISHANDILDVLKIQGITIEYQSEEVKADTKEEGLILPHLSKNPIHLDDIIRKTGLSPAKLGSTITLMEMKGKIRRLEGNYFLLGR